MISAREDASSDDMGISMMSDNYYPEALLRDSMDDSNSDLRFGKNDGRGTNDNIGMVYDHYISSPDSSSHIKNGKIVSSEVINPNLG